MVSWGPEEHRPFTVADDPRERVRREIFEHDAGPARPRQIVGFIYEAICKGQRDGQHIYVGKVMGATQAAVTERFHGKSSSAHTSPASIARDPWKAHILPGRRGYRILERVRDQGGTEANDAAVRRAEAFWIDRLRPRENRVRPVRPAGERPAPRPRPRPVASRPAAKPARRKGWRPAPLFAFFVAIYTAAVAYALAPSPVLWVPWVVSPMLGLALGYRTYLWTQKAARKTARRRR